MMMTIVCPKCQAVAKLSLVDTDYSGPRRCWKCHEFFTITIRNNQVTSCEPLSQEEYERQQAAQKAAEKMRGSVSFASQEKQRNTYQKPPAQQQMSMEFPSKDMPAIFPPSSSKPPAAKEPPKSEQADFFQSLPQTSQKGIEFSSPPKQEAAPKTQEKPQSGIEFSSAKKPEAAPKPPPRQPDWPKPAGYKDPPLPSTPKGPAIFPPERYSTFIPVQDIPEDAARPAKAKNSPSGRQDWTKPSPGDADPGKPVIFPPERYSTFVPLEETDEDSEKK